MRPVVIWLHGSGDTGAGAQSWLQSLAPSSELAAFDWEFPDAEIIPYTLQGGAPASVWYDRVGGFDPHYPEQTPSVERSAARIVAAIDGHIARGVPPGKIAVGGFSMGGNLAYQTAARFHSANEKSLGAVFCLSGYTPDDSKMYASLGASKWPPAFVAHGAADDFILPQWGRATYERLKASGIDASFRLVPRAKHEMAPAEIAELLGFLGSQFAKCDAARDAA